MSEILIVGRGPSTATFDWSAVSMPIMAVSSGMFAVPDVVPVQEFVTMDPLKFFMADLMNCEISWGNDPQITHRMFWRDPSIRKHVLESRLEPGQYRTLPEGIWDVIPERHLRKFQKALTSSMHAFGFQPSWGDCTNVRGWAAKFNTLPNLLDVTEPLGIDGIKNSWFIAVQIAVLLGYRRLHFIGCDFRHECYDAVLPTIKKWHDLFTDAGVEWVNLSPESRLSDIINMTEVAA